MKQTQREALRELSRKREGERERDRVSGQERDREGRRRGGGVEVARGGEEGDLTQIGNLTAATAAAE